LVNDQGLAITVSNELVPDKDIDSGYQKKIKIEYSRKRKKEAVEVAEGEG
jgi:hypothetical protein